MRPPRPRSDTVFHLVHPIPDNLDGRRAQIMISDGRMTLSGALCVHDRSSPLIVVPIAQGDLGDASRDAALADALRMEGFNTLLLHLLVPRECAIDQRTARVRQQVRLLTDRFLSALNAFRVSPLARNLRVGVFASGTATAIGLRAAVAEPGLVRAVVSRSGRPDLAGTDLERVITPTLLLVGEQDRLLVRINEQAQTHFSYNCRLEIVLGASRTFDGPGKTAVLVQRARDFFETHLTAPN